MTKEVVFRNVVKAAHDYAATADYELTVKKDQLLFLLEILYFGWAKVQVHTPLGTLSEAQPAVGLVPSTSIETPLPMYRAVALHDYEPNGEGEVMMKENETMDVYLKEDERILVKIDRKGILSYPAIGYVPANYVKKAEDGGEVPEDLSEVESEEDTVIPVTVPPTPRSRGIIVVVLHDFEANLDDELTVREGEKLTVLNDEDLDWWKCCNLKGDEGLAPASYLSWVG